MNNLLTKLGVASTSSIIVTEAVNLDALWSALISLGVSILSVLAVEGISFLKAWFLKKKKDLDDSSKGGN